VSGERTVVGTLLVGRDQQTRSCSHPRVILPCRVGNVGGGHLWKVLASVMLAALLFAVFLWTAPLGEVGRNLAQVKLGWVLASVAVALGTYALRALRWGLILRPVGRAGTANLLAAPPPGSRPRQSSRHGQERSCVLCCSPPDRNAGGSDPGLDPHRAPSRRSYSTVALRRGGALRGRQPQSSESATPPRHRAADHRGPGAAVALIWFLLRRREATVRRVASWLPERLHDRAVSFLHHLLDGLEVLRTPRRLFEIAVWSLGLWIVIGWQLVLLGKAFGLELSLGQALSSSRSASSGSPCPLPQGWEDSTGRSDSD